MIISVSAKFILIIRSFLGMDFSPVALKLIAVDIWRHGPLSGFPGSWANLTVLLIELEGLKLLQCSYLNKSEILSNIPSDTQIINADVPEDLLVIDDEGASEGDTLFGQHSVVVGDLR